MQNNQKIKLVSFFIFISLGCSSKENNTSPRHTITKLLKLHDLLGIMPEHRSAKSKKREVDESALLKFFTDYKKGGDFISNTFSGFVVGVLARHQDSLIIEKNKNTAKVKAGKALIVMQFVNGKWKINLNLSVPDIIKKRAYMTQKRLIPVQQAAP